MSIIAGQGLPTPSIIRWGNAARGDMLARLHELIARETGLHFRSQRLSVLRDAVERRVTALGLTSVDEYLLELELRPDELGDLVDALTVGETAFFRQPRVFHALSRIILSKLTARHDRPVRLWSAGCSTGEEAYSLAMCAWETSTWSPGSDIEVLGTDLNARALSRARLGLYPAERLRDVPPRFRRRCFEPFVDERGRYLAQVDEAIQRHVRFERHNLVGGWWPDGHWDVVLCQNVLMYFRPELRRRTLEHLVSSLSPNGYVIVSPAELPAEPLFGTMRPENRAGVLVYCRR